MFVFACSGVNRACLTSPDDPEDVSDPSSSLYPLVLASRKCLPKEGDNESSSDKNQLGSPETEMLPCLTDGGLEFELFHCFSEVRSLAKMEFDIPEMPELPESSLAAEFNASAALCLGESENGEEEGDEEGSPPGLTLSPKMCYDSDLPSESSGNMKEACSFPENI